MFIVMAGLPGTGKSTIAEQLGRQLGLAVVSVDPIESAILSAGIDAGQPTGLAAYLVAERIADSVLSSPAAGVIIDAVNAVEPARLQWVRLAERHGERRTRFIEVFCSDPEVHRERLEPRSRELAHLAEPSWHAVEQSLDEWEPWIGPSAEVPRLRLDSVRPVDENVAEALGFAVG